MDSRTLSPNRKILRGATLTVTCSVIGACTGLATDRLTVSDWCWLHYRLAPPGALAFDPGPESAEAATDWGIWLGSTADAPQDRSEAHREQHRLIHDYMRSDSWTTAARTRYRAAAQSEPSPDTVCETVGARVTVAADGSLPSDWGVRFLDPDDPAYSTVADNASLADDEDTADDPGLDR